MWKVCVDRGMYVVGTAVGTHVVRNVVQQVASAYMVGTAVGVCVVGNMVGTYVVGYAVGNVVVDCAFGQPWTSERAL